MSGPEYSLDLTYFLVNNFEGLKLLEREMQLNEFCNSKPPVDETHQSMEFRIIQKISCHKDHAQNFFVSANSTFFKLNRHKDVLPFKHSRVELDRSPYKQTDADDEDAEFTYDFEEKIL